jgi:energy-coupling factor transport system substrate-specific component
MSWPVATFLIVGLVLLLGLLAYERSRPSARMAAVVATLAAVAALGRDAFVALPEVKPITVIVFVVGYALGPLPGFAVGAVGMLASNVMLGQGPYTPWQMAAWGLVGLAGAAVGRFAGGRLGRLPLALGCACAALFAKEIMNVYDWTVGTSHTPAALLLEVGKGLPFDAVDVGATFLFGLAFAPELARVLVRVRARMDIRWEAVGAATLTAFFAIGALPVRVSSAEVPRAAAARANLTREIAYLASAQDSGGGWGAAPGQPSSELFSAWAAIGLAAAGRSPLSVRRDGHTVLDALRAQAGTLEGPGDIERTMLALRACGASVTALAGKNLPAGLLRYRAGDGAFSNLVNVTSFAVLALRASGRSAGDPVVRGAAAWIAREQGADGGFSFAGRGGASDVDDTAAAVQALVAAGVRGGAVARAAAFIVRAQNPDGGLPAQPRGESNAQSTSWAVQGLLAAGVNVAAVRRRGGRTPLGYIESLVAPSGSVRYSRTGAVTPVWVTAQALTALALAPFPIR